MTISPMSPMRQDYVTKREFNEKFDAQNEYIDTGFTRVDEKIDEVESNLGKKIDGLEVRFDEQKAYMNDGFEKVFKQMDEVETNLGKKMDALAGETNKRFDVLEHKTDSLTKMVNKIATVLKV